MAQFFNDLASSIFTPGPTPSLIIATNVSFGCLQLLLLVLFVATYSIHFAILSFLTAGLWWAINWFAKELQEAKLKEEEAGRLRKKRRSDEDGVDDSGDETETEKEDDRGMARNRLGDESVRLAGRNEGGGMAKSEGSGVRRREKLDASGELSTEDEWEKVSEEGGKDR